jgi:hypothetical protein
MYADVDSVISTGNSNIRHYQARAAAQVYSTARNVLPGWTTNYWLPEPESATTPSPAATSALSDTQDPSTTFAATAVDHTLPDRFAAFDVLRGRDVFVTAKDCAFTIYDVCDSSVELEELCGYTCTNNQVLSVKVTQPSIDISFLDRPKPR